MIYTVVNKSEVTERSGTMKLTVKRWIADQKREEMKRFNYFANMEYVNGYYADTENDTVTYSEVEVLKETKKAVLVSIECGNIDGNAGAYKVWMPKSQIVAMA